MLDWINAKASYDADYSWTGGSLRTIDTLGSVIQNGQNIQLTADLRFTKLYDKSKYLKKINKKRPSSKSKRKSRKKKKDDISVVERVLIRPLLLVRSARLSYNENRYTIVPGFMSKPDLLGLSPGFDAPGWEFVAGIQPDLGSPHRRGWLDDVADEGWISNSIFQSQEVLQGRDRKATAKLTIEPFRDFKIDLNMEWDKSLQSAELYADTLNDGMDEFLHLVPTESGSYKISYLALQTMFDNDLRGLFTKFENNRPRASQRIADSYNITNPHSDTDLARRRVSRGIRIEPYRCVNAFFCGCIYR